jgi:hypothetical protein
VILGSPLLMGNTWIFNVYPYRTKVLVYLPIGLATWSFLE